MGPDQPLPYDGSCFDNAQSYVASLLDFVGNNELPQTLCGGVHLLDFFTNEPDLYSKILPQDWREFFAEHEMIDLLDLFMREDVDLFSNGSVGRRWRDGPLPPASLVKYLVQVRQHLLNREINVFQCSQNRTQKKLARHVAVGMNVKKVHEVGLYAEYLDQLASSITATGHNITHLVDFGSGQNYLGRALASEPYNRNIVAIESKAHNSERAKDYDVKAHIVEKKRMMRNKKNHRSGQEEVEAPQRAPPRSEAAKAKWPDIERTDAVQYVDHRIQDGDLGDVIARIAAPTTEKDKAMEQSVMVMSLHSCGNLVHHGLRSLTLNPAVKAVALVGCCYNLLTERLGPATYKLPELRPTTHLHPRLRSGSTTNGDAEGDPAGFPMSARLAESDVRLNITARMMAVQAPQNWGQKDSESFFTRHFYRALLQRVFLDYGIVGPPSPECAGEASPAGHSSAGTPITIGSLRKGCYESFVAYARGALSKLCAEDAVNPELGKLVAEKMATVDDGMLKGYEKRFAARKKDLSVIWSLMAFSAGVVEAVILVDRWCWLEEQEEVGEAWVEPVFGYGHSPRNLVVVGVKK
ncbi:uncharacterized protein LTR77_009736 [Saxophila tyrrhenica]|uniref:Methyltransferase domain-containing protein n=1 Tax=Saxophila tyrrhenica TaxID=1690608 RepID=A0AAV9NXM9_9PEZI|nr:hypothetical protein LTR77_009736 [Saxophila tyrrhenica]